MNEEPDGLWEYRIHFLRVFYRVMFLSHHSLRIITTGAGSGTALAAGLAGPLAAGFEAAGRSLASLGSDTALA